MSKKHRLSVVLVSDFEPSDTKSWKDERLLLQSLANQDIEEPFEVVLVESEHNKSQTVPDELYHLIPDLIIGYYDSDQSATLKDFGVGLTSGEYIAVLESDCVPSKNWLRLLLEPVVNNQCAISSGRTYYGEQTSYKRIMNLLHRSWYDHGKSCETNYISNNGAIYTREILEQFPYPHAITPFLSAQIRNEKIHQAGHKFYYERDVLMIHAIGGLPFIWDLQRNKGHQRMSSFWRITYSSIPRILISKLQENLRQCKQHGKEYLKWYDWPMLVFYMFFSMIPFTVGMVDALHEVQKIPGSAYR
jgi:hypothetical protein